MIIDYTIFYGKKDKVQIFILIYIYTALSYINKKKINTI